MQPSQTRRQTAVVESEKILFVEGKWDEHFLSGLCRQRDVRGIQVFCVAGNKRDQYEAGIKAFLNQTYFQAGRVCAVGFLRDSDGFTDASSTPDGAFQSLCSLFRKLGWPEPKDTGEFVQTPLGCRAAIHIVPARGQRGMLETLCMAAVGADPAALCVEEYLKCLCDKGQPVKDHVKDKARLQAFIASRPEPQISLGVLFRETNLLCYESAVYDPLVAFLKSL